MSDNLCIVTAGADGYFRIWKAGKIIDDFKNKVSEQNVGNSDEQMLIADVEPHIEVFNQYGEIDCLAVSKCNDILSTVSAKQTVFWATSTGEELAILPTDIPPITSTFKVSYFEYRLFLNF